MKSAISEDVTLRAALSSSEQDVRARHPPLKSHLCELFLLYLLSPRLGDVEGHSRQTRFPGDTLLSGPGLSRYKLHHALAVNADRGGRQAEQLVSTLQSHLSILPAQPVVLARCNHYHGGGASPVVVVVVVGRLSGPLTLKFDRATWPFLKNDSRH